MSVASCVAGRQARCERCSGEVSPLLCSAQLVQERSEATQVGRVTQARKKKKKRKEAALSVLHGKSKKRKKVTSKSFSWQSPGEPGHYVDDDRFK